MTERASVAAIELMARFLTRDQSHALRVIADLGTLQFDHRRNWKRGFHGVYETEAEDLCRVGLARRWRWPWSRWWRYRLTATGKMVERIDRERRDKFFRQSLDNGASESVA